MISNCEILHTYFENMKVEGFNLQNHNKEVSLCGFSVIFIPLLSNHEPTGTLVSYCSVAAVNTDIAFNTTVPAFRTTDCPIARVQLQ